MKCLNNEKRKELAWQPPFEFYFGRKRVTNQFPEACPRIEAPQKLKNFKADEK